MADEIKKESAETSKSKAKDKAKTDKVKADKSKKDTASKKSGDSADKKPNVFVRIGHAFARMGKVIARFFKDEKGECKKIVWPDRKTVLKSSLVVIVCVVILGFIIWLIDTGLSEGVRALVNLAERVGSEEDTTAAAGRIVSGLLGF